MQLQISPITLIIVLVYVSGLAFQIGRIYEQLRQAKQKAAEQSMHLTGGSLRDLPAVITLKDGTTLKRDSTPPTRK